MKKTSYVLFALIIVAMLYCVGENVNAVEVEIEEPLKVTTLYRKYEKAKLLSIAKKQNASGEDIEEVIEIEDYTDKNENIIIEDNAEKKSDFIDIEKTQEIITKLLNTCAAGAQRVIEAPEKEAKLARELAKSREQVLKNWEAKKAEEEAQRAKAEAEAARVALEKEKEVLVEAPTDGENIVVKDGVPTNYVKVMNVTATAYCICQKCCGKSPSSPGYGVTASGLRIIPGTGMKVIAVDPKVVKLGTHVYVEGLNGSPDYGYAIAADTGGAIKNMKIDLYFDSHADTIKWGRRQVKLYILPD